MSVVEDRLVRLRTWARTDAAAVWCSRAALVLAVPVFYVVGRHQWFNRDDWAFVLTREQMRTGLGWDNWLFAAQDGHWLTIPILLFSGVLRVFGLGSYWPFLLLALVSHIGAVALARVLCRRVGVSAWTTTLLGATLLFFGAGWHNLTFAIQVCYSLSVVCFLGQVLLVDHDGPLDRRDIAGSILGLLGVMTSGFGPIFMAGVAVLLVLRRRWAALAVVVAPQALAYLWWTIAWAGDAPSVVPPGDRSQVPEFAVYGITATFEGLLGIPALAGLGLVAVLATLFGGVPWAARRVTLASAATVIVMFAGIGWQRVGLGIESAGASRYVGVAALVLAPALGLAIDAARRIAPAAQLAARIVLCASLLVNLGTLRSAGATFAQGSRHEQLVFELLAGSDRLASLPHDHVPVPNSPDVNIAEIPYLVAEGALTPRQPVDDAQRALLEQALTTGIVAP